MAAPNKTPCGNTKCTHYKKGVLLNCKVPILLMTSPGCGEYVLDLGFGGDLSDILNGFMGGQTPF